MDISGFANGRTRGDGMEFLDTEKVNTKSIDDLTNHCGMMIPGATTIYRVDDMQSDSVKLPAKVPKGKPFYLVPHLVETKKNTSLRNKAPKFVPFEPYKAAVSNLFVYSLMTME